jgi:flagellar biosynthesis chaperone FliJ
MTKLIVLILRCCLDDETTLTNAYEKILRQFASGAPVSVVDANLRMLSTKSRRYQKDWKRALHQLMPLCNKNASTFISVMQQMVKHKNNEVVVSPTKSDTDTHEHMMTTNGNDSVLKMVGLKKNLSFMPFQLYVKPLT